MSVPIGTDLILDAYSSSFKGHEYTRVDLVRSTPGFKPFTMQIGEGYLVMLYRALLVLKTFDLRMSALNTMPIRLPVGGGLVLTASTEVSENTHRPYRSLCIVRIPRAKNDKEEDGEEVKQEEEEEQKEPKSEYKFWIRFELLEALIEALHFILKVNKMI